MICYFQMKEQLLSAPCRTLVYQTRAYSQCTALDKFIKFIACADIWQNQRESLFSLAVDAAIDNAS
jgi:hypothetical protein